jgi:tetratricopeptide (TPR) repeat protein
MDPLTGLKRLSPEAIPRALEKAERYRLLNKPAEAASICEDILAVDPGNQSALVLFVLALTDQFDRPGSRGTDRAAREVLGRLNDPYQAVYYAGVIAEREGRAHLGRGVFLESAYGCFRAAMEHYEKAAQLRPPGNDDAILRWNSCLRAIREARLTPTETGSELPLE